MNGIPEDASAALDALERTATALIEADAAADRYAKRTPRHEWSAAEHRKLLNAVRDRQRDFAVCCAPELILTLIEATRASTITEVTP
jgi:hypothetical protein